jgi:glycosyltransferase involved in cell wall biosynthesis
VHLTVVTEQLRAPVPGGTGRYTAELLRALQATAGDGEEVDGWDAPGTSLPARARRPLLAELWRRGIGPAPRHTECVFAPTLLAPPRRRRPLVVTIHDAVPWTDPQTLTARGARWHRAMATRVAADADVVLTPTAIVASQLREHLTLRQIEVVGEGVSAAVGTPPADAEARARRLGLPPEFALAVGTLEPRKGLDVAAAACKDPQWPDLPLLIAGPSGWGDVRVPAGVRALGHLADADLATVYSRATLMVAPSRAEGFGLPVLEAMTHGVPVVISDAPALVEIAGNAAVVVPRDDPPALAAGAQQALRERVRWADAGLKRSRNFSWEKAAVRIRSICHDLLSPGSR